MAKSADKPFYDRIKLHFRQADVDDRANKKLRCIKCGTEVSGTTRCIIHLAGSKGGKGAEVVACPADKVEAELRQQALEYLRRRKQSSDHPGAPSATDPEGISNEGGGKRARTSTSGSGHASISGSRQTAIGRFYAPAKSVEADKAIAQLFYECGLPFNVSRHAAFHEMIAAVTKAGAGYKAPSYNKLRTEMLDQVGIDANCLNLLPHADCCSHAPCNVERDACIAVLFAGTCRCDQQAHLMLLTGAGGGHRHR
jgi:hypothetical protein